MEPNKKCCCFKNIQRRVEEVSKAVLTILVMFVLGLSFLFLFFGSIRKFTGGQEILNKLKIVDSIPNETLLTLLSLLVAFGSILAYIFEKIVRKNLEEETRKTLGNRVELFDKEILETKNEIQTLLEDARIASRADGDLAAAISLLFVYKSTYNNDIDGE